MIFLLSYDKGSDNVNKLSKYMLLSSASVGLLISSNHTRVFASHVKLPQTHRPKNLNRPASYDDDFDLHHIPRMSGSTVNGKLIYVAIHPHFIDNRKHVKVHYSDKYKLIPYVKGKDTTNFMVLPHGYSHILYNITHTDNKKQLKVYYKEMNKLLNKDKSWKNTERNFVVSSKDLREKVNAYRLTKKQQIELLRWWQQVDLSLMMQAGGIVPVGSLKAQQFAATIAHRYNKDKWNLFKKNNHDINGINEISKRWHLDYNTKFSEGQLYESLAAYEGITYKKLRHTNIGFLKAYIWTAATNMMFEDGSEQWGHSADLTGLDSSTDALQKAIGVSFDHMGQVHFEGVDDTDTSSSEFLKYQNTWVENDK